jgi:hypothetical protein
MLDALGVSRRPSLSQEQREHHRDWAGLFETAPVPGSDVAFVKKAAVVEQRRLVEDARQASGRFGEFMKNLFAGCPARFSHPLFNATAQVDTLADQGLQVGDGDP